MSTYQELLRRRKDRACAVILSLKEREVDPLLQDPAVSDRLRKVILDQLNDVYEVARDIVSSLEGSGTIYNEEYLKKLDDIYEMLVLNGSH